jgi:argininosuccinate lyase
MPQKKNPHALERVKALAGQAVGWLPAVMGCQRPVLSTDLDLAFGDDVVTPCGDATLGALRLMTEVIGTLVVHAAAMAAKAGANWSTASHLADELVRRHDLPFRTAHQVVARFVRDAIAAGQGSATAAPELLGRAAAELAGREVALTAAELGRILDPRAFVESRTTEGSVNPREVRVHVRDAEAALDGRRRWQEAKADHRQASRAGCRAGPGTTGRPASGSPPWPDTSPGSRRSTGTGGRSDARRTTRCSAAAGTRPRGGASASGRCSFTLTLTPAIGPVAQSE